VVQLASKVYASDGERGTKDARGPVTSKELLSLLHKAVEPIAAEAPLTLDWPLCTTDARQCELDTLTLLCRSSERWLPTCEQLFSRVERIWMEGTKEGARCMCFPPKLESDLMDEVDVFIFTMHLEIDVTCTLLSTINTDEFAGAVLLAALTSLGRAQPIHASYLARKAGTSEMEIRGLANFVLELVFTPSHGLGQFGGIKAGLPVQTK